MEGISKERILEILNGAEPTSTEKLLLVERRNRIMRQKAIAERNEKLKEAHYSNLKEELEESKINKNKRRNIRKKIRRSK